VFRIKICGITNVADALMVAAAGADAVGLNFYPASPRCIDLERAEKIVEALPEGIIKVGLFVNAPVRDIRGIFDRLELDLIQLAGDETPEFLAEIGPRPVMKVLRQDAATGWSNADYLDRCRSLAHLPRMVLLDAQVPGEYGGTGHLADWQAAADYARLADAPALVLAGGLTAENVAEAIRTVHPAAVDTASGVESSPGHKDAGKVSRFVNAARDAFEHS
jgi:phosphoribosylanthranilate isomerase